MPSQKITDAWIRNLTWARAANRYLREDQNNPKFVKQLSFIDTLDRGLAIVCVLSSGGTKAWRVLTYERGKAVSCKIGTYPAMSVKAARDKAREHFKNPEKFKAQVAAGTFKDVAENWFKRHVEHNKLRSRNDLRRHIDRYIFPKWKNIPFHEIGRGKVTELLDEISDNHGPSSADAILATIRAIMAWHEARSDNYRSPIARGMKRAQSTKRDRVLNPIELAAVWSAAGECGMFGAFIKILLLTGQRRDKVAKMRRADISDDGVWSIPSEDEREKGTAGIIRLPRMAIVIIEALDKIADHPFVFAGRGGRAMNAFSRGKNELDRLLPPMPRWTIHDLRRTARTLMSDAGVRPDIAERVLGHSIPGVGGVYDKSEYFVQKSEALDALAQRIESIVNTADDNAVLLRQT
ncbi:MAG: integrase arm-type DNA-binding domain-containing protein [Xanthobacteraceae bacterium]